MEATQLGQKGHLVIADVVDWDADVNDCQHAVEGPCEQCDAEGTYGWPSLLSGPDAEVSVLNRGGQ